MRTFSDMIMNYIDNDIKITNEIYELKTIKENEKMAFIDCSNYFKKDPMVYSHLGEPIGRITQISIDSSSIAEPMGVSFEGSLYTCYGAEDLAKEGMSVGKHKGIRPVRIICNGPATIVFWNDNTKTVVKVAEGDDDNLYAAVAFALAKKLYGSNSHFKKLVDRAVE